MKKITKYVFSALILLTAFTYFSCKQNLKPDPESVNDKTGNGEYIGFGFINDEGNVKQAHLYYTSIDTQGNEITLSGYFEYDSSQSIKQIVLNEHGTIQYKNQGPSDSGSNQGIPAVEGRLVVCPDYIGYGVSKVSVHPYMNAELTAINSLDCLFAVMKILEKKIDKNAYTIVAGYSQGGEAALATTKYIEHNLSAAKKAKINLKESYCGGTPADLVATMDSYFAREAKVVVPKTTDTTEITKFANENALEIGLSYLVIQGMMESYPEEFEGKEIKDFYDSSIDTYKLAVALKAENDTDFYNNLMGAVQVFFLQSIMKIEDVKLIEIYSADMRNADSDLNKAFVNCLKKNDLTDWEPKHPITFYHSEEDDVVPFVNYENLMAENKFGRYESLVKGITGKGTHGGFYSEVYSKQVLALLNK